MKGVLFFLFGFTCYFYTMSQNVSIELSIHWQIEKDIFDEDTMTNTPILNVTYRNNSGDNIYFKKISLSDEVGLPRTGYGSLLHPIEGWVDPNWQKRAEIALEMSSLFINENYRVEIGGYQPYSGGWHIINKADTCVECETDLINDNISYIHEFIFRKKYQGRLRVLEKYQFKKEDLSEDGILNAKRHNFVFLKPNDFCTDTFNLVAFQLLKGNYTFAIGENTIPDFVWDIAFWDDIQKKYIEQKIKLPDKVGEYQLYSGLFFANSITVDFSKYD